MKRKYNIENYKEYQRKYRESHKEQAKIYKKEYAIKNKDKIRIKKRAYYESHIEEKKEYDRNHRPIYYSKNREKINKQINLRNISRRKDDIQFKLKCRLRGRLNDVIRGDRKSGSSIKDLGCTVSELKQYLESKFEKGMNWNNWSLRGWHIDHKIALTNFDLTDRKQLLKAVHYSNLQPMWWRDNIKKSNKTSC